MEKLHKTLIENSFIGIVENNIDPDKKQRVQIRIPFLHGDKKQIPTEDLPWSHPVKSNQFSFNVPDKDKIVNVRFPTGDLYYSIYDSVQHLNVNLQKKIESLSDNDYKEFIALCYNHNTQIFIDETDGLTIQHKYNHINIKNDITLGLKDISSKIYLGSNTAAQSAVLGTNWFIWFDKFMTTLPQMFLATAPGAPVAPTPQLIQLIAEYFSLKVTFESQHVAIVDNLAIKPSTERFNGQIGDKYDMAIDEANVDINQSDLGNTNQSNTNDNQSNIDDNEEVKDVESYIPDNYRAAKEQLLDEGLTVTNTNVDESTATIRENDETYGIKPTESELAEDEATDEEYEIENAWTFNASKQIEENEQQDNSPENAMEIYMGLKSPTPAATTTQAILSPEDILPNPASGNDLKDVLKIAKYMKSKGYVVYTEQYHMNIVGIRGKHKDKGVITNKYDDYLWQFFKNKDDKWELYKFRITTTPGYKRRSTILPSNVGMIVYGQYENTYSIGWHCGRDGTTYRDNGKRYLPHACLKNAKVVVTRHGGGDRRYKTRNEIKTTRTEIGKGFNIHRSSATGESNAVYNYSQGCQVFKSIHEFNIFMKNNYAQRDIGGKSSFTYTLIPHSEFAKFK